MPDSASLTPLRTVFFVSDGTGITAETFGHSILAQFNIRVRQVRLPFIDSIEKAKAAMHTINDTCEQEGQRAIVFSTLVKDELSIILRRSQGLYMDLLQTFISPLEQEFGVSATHTIRRGHTNTDSIEYKNRIEAINFSLAHDDGQSSKNLDDADVILVGVSRSGKTPTALFLAMQYGIKAANYPLTPDDFDRRRLPASLQTYRGKMFGLSIAPERLTEIRNERFPGSKYAAFNNCRYEVAEAEDMMRREGIRWLSSTTKSIEEIAATILQELQLERKAN